VEGSAPSETEEKPTRGFGVRGAGNMGAAATRGSFAPQFGKKEKTQDDGDTPESTGNLAESRSGLAALRREHWERLERSHRRKDRATGRKVRRHKQRPRKGTVTM
jgi:hypothetical protein